MVAGETTSAASAAATTRGTRLPKDWQLPRAWGEWALVKYPQWADEKVRDEALKFRNHWTALTGKSATRLDWLATWQNWCMNDLAHRDDMRPAKANGSHGAMSVHGLQTMRNAEALEAKLFKDEQHAA